jgi:hypothetical protein
MANPSFLNWNLQSSKGYYLISSQKDLREIEPRTAIYSYEDEETLKEGIKEWLVQWFFNSRKALKLPIIAIDANETFKDFLNIIDNMDKIKSYENLNKFNSNYAGINFQNDELPWNAPIREAYIGVDYIPLSPYSLTFEDNKEGFVRFFSSIGWWDDVEEYDEKFSFKSLTVIKR